ncbi:MAG: protein phosphatase 2C domain-containing protein [Desulfobacterales bacterium]
MTKKLPNCWEYMKCGREKGGINAAKSGVCPVASESVFDGFNGGRNCGRMCWLIAGTFCNGKIQGNFAQKQGSCKNCEFYRQVQHQGTTSFHAGHVNIVGATHIGKVKKTNEDRYLIKKLSDGSMLMAVADGLGGDVAGDYAAEIIRGRLSGTAHIEKGEEQSFLVKMLKDTDAALRKQADADADLEAMGTTLVCVLLREEIAHWVHAGDSRLYLFRNSTLVQISKDQTLARFLLEEGLLALEKIPQHYSRHVMDQFVGCGYCEPETGHIKTQAKDLLVLMSDGLHKYVGKETVSGILNAQTDMEGKAEFLIASALEAGGQDNITVVLCEICCLF